MNRINTGPGGGVDLDNVFTYHPPQPDQIARFEAIRNEGKALAAEIAEKCPPSPERSTALAKVREAVMWANAAIACNEKPAEDQPEPEVVEPPKGFHSRACGIRKHDHGPECHPNCPTCHGKALQ